MNDIVIRKETPDDYKEVENLTREAFFNINVPGCSEHYLAHIIRKHEDFLPELDLVAVMDDKIVGNVMYTKSKLIDEKGNEKNILTFGPISVLPSYQRKGIGKALLNSSFEKAVKMGYDAIVIFGSTSNYLARGFKSCKRFNITLENNVFPSAMLVKELKPNVFDGHHLIFHESSAFENIDEKQVEEFDKLFEPKKKEITTAQEEFFIMSNSTIN